MEILQIYQLVFCNSSALYCIYLQYRIQSYTLSQFPASITSAVNITWVWYDCKARNFRLHVWKLPYLYLTHVQYFKHVFKPHRTINNDLNISHNQQSTTRAWMHARMLPNYLCYESVGLVCFVGFFYPSIGSYRSLLQSFEIFVIPLLYMIKLCTSGFAVNRKIRETCWYINSSEKTLDSPRIWSV